MENLTAGDLRIEVKRDPEKNAVELHWLGKSNERNPTQVLQPYFRRMLEQAKQSSCLLALHFEHLEHFNSSTITAIIQLIQDARNAGVRLMICFDQKVKWQKLSFDALRVFAKGDGLLEVCPILD
jgi:hypothetical protein